MKGKIGKTIFSILSAAMILSFSLPLTPISAMAPENAGQDHAKVKVVKVDSIANVGLSGATFGIYRDEACTDLITNMAETDENGETEQEVAVTQDRIYLKEITAPSGYRCNSMVYQADLEAGRTISITIPGTEQLGSLDIAAKGHVLTEAEPDGEGMEFRYWRSMEQKGAVFNVYAGEDIVTPYGAVIYRTGDMVAENLETGDKGSALLENLHLGTYRITPVQAPYKFYNTGQRKTVSMYQINPEEWRGGAIFYFDRQTAKVSVAKIDKDTASEVAGTVFGLYAAEDIQNEFGDRIVEKDTLIEKATTDADGIAAFTEEIPADFEYYVKEEQETEGYQKNMDVYSFRFDYNNGKDAEAEFSHVFTGAKITASIQLSRTDIETNQPQGDATLKNAVYGLYAREDIIHPDQTSGAVYQVGEQAATLVTDYNGSAKIENLYPGEYFIKEITPSAGYLPDEKEHDINCSYEGEQAVTIERSCITSEQVIKQPFQIIKTADSEETDIDLSGAGFCAYLVSLLEKKENGEYDLDAAMPMVIGENGETEIFTDKNGSARSIPLPYGTYLIHETTTPHNSKQVNDFTIQITEHDPDNPQVCRLPVIAENHLVTVSIKKTDLRDRKAVEGAELQVTDADGNVVEAWTSGKEPYIISKLTAGENYLLTENSPADGYATAESITFTPTNTEEIQEIEMQDDVTKVEITKADFSGKNVRGAKLVILDKTGNETESWISENKAHYIEMLPIGEYTLHEESAPEGYFAAEDITFKVIDIGVIQRIIMGSKAKSAENPKEINPEESDSEKDNAKNPASDISISEKPDSTKLDSEVTVPETINSEMSNQKFQEQKKQTEQSKYQSQQPEKAGQETRTQITPKTGDKNSLLFWLILSVLASCIFIFSLIFLSHRKIKKSHL